MNQKGQALVEFILILPVILLILMALIDVGNIFLEKFNLNNQIETVSEMYQNNEEEKLRAYVAKEDLIYDEKVDNNLVTITLSKNIEINAPFLNKALGDNHQIKTDKTFYKEETINE